MPAAEVRSPIFIRFFIPLVLVGWCLVPALADSGKWHEYKNAGEQAEIERDYAKAEYWYGKALEETERSGGNTPQLEETLTRCAASYVMMGQMDKAEPLYERAMKNAFDDQARAQNPEYLVLLEDLADAYASQDKGPNMETCLRHAIDIRQRVSGGKHTKLATVLYKLAQYYASCSRWKDALPISERALHSYETLQGKTNVYTAQCMLIIGQAYRGLHQYDKSLEALNNSLVMMRKIAPCSTYESCIIRYEGEVALERKKYADALALFDQALKIDQKIDGKNGLYEYSDYNSLAELYEKKGELLKAEENYRQVVELFSKRVGPDNIAVAGPSLKLASVLRKLHRQAEADKLETRARLIYKAQHKND